MAIIAMILAVAGASFAIGVVFGDWTGQRTARAERRLHWGDRFIGFDNLNLMIPERPNRLDAMAEELTHYHNHPHGSRGLCPSCDIARSLKQLARVVDRLEQTEQDDAESAAINAAEEVRAIAIN